jgi:hypothetical protein
MKKRRKSQKEENYWRVRENLREVYLEVCRMPLGVRKRLEDDLVNVLGMFITTYGSVYDDSPSFSHLPRGWKGGQYEDGSRLT